MSLDGQVNTHSVSEKRGRARTHSSAPTTLPEAVHFHCCLCWDKAAVCFPLSLPLSSGLEWDGARAVNSSERAVKRGSIKTGGACARQRGANSVSHHQSLRPSRGLTDWTGASPLYLELQVSTGGAIPVRLAGITAHSRPRTVLHRRRSV